MKDFLQLFMMKTKAVSSSVNITPAKKAKTKCSLLGWPERQGAEVTAEAAVGWVPGPLSFGSGLDM